MSDSENEKDYDTRGNKEEYARIYMKGYNAGLRKGRDSNKNLIKYYREKLSNKK